MLTLIATPHDTGRLLGERVRALRLVENWTRDTLAARAGVSPSSLRRFETTGKASLDLVLRVAHALGRLDDFHALLKMPPARSLAELERQVAQPKRKRGRR
jgi:transcriptional regulator with XRE-family HTH domain